MRIDCLQYVNWSEKIFQQLQAGKVDAIHVTIAYHENFRETVANFERWNRWFERYPELIMRGLWAEDIDLARKNNVTAVFFGFQNCSPIEDDIGLVEIVHRLGARFMQLTYNNQSLLASGCYEPVDAGISRMGREVIKEMNRVGLVIDMSHSADQSTIEAASISTRPIAITHANPHEWSAALRNKKHEVIDAVTKKGGMMGFSLYPHHLQSGSSCTLESFCDMVKAASNRYGAQHFGLGSDLCQDQPDEIVTWMRVGRWTKAMDYGEGSASNPGFPAMPSWFQDNRDFGNIEKGLRAAGMRSSEIEGFMGANWYRFFKESFVAQTGTQHG
ncbi:MAG: membrane dipeptidase [Alphaproteobacteria bacterium]